MSYGEETGTFISSDQFFGILSRWVKYKNLQQQPRNFNQVDHEYLPLIDFLPNTGSRWRRIYISLHLLNFDYPPSVVHS